MRAWRSGMRALRSERLAAALLIAAAVVGLVLANSPAAPGVEAVRETHLGPAALGLDLSVAHWITDGLLAVFFLLAAIELKNEVVHGELDSPRKALLPAVAAVGGVLAPALIYLAIARDPAEARGWPVPTATDIAFALGVLSLVGRGLPPRIRATLLALAVLDDLIAITLIAVLFTKDLAPVPLLLAVVAVVAFAVGARMLRRARRGAPRIALVAALVVLGVLAWALVHASGVHATVAGVALGLVLPSRVASPLHEALTPFSNGIVLPLFALTAASVAIPAVSPGQLRPLFWAIVVALPVGKVVGITAGALLARMTRPRRERRSALPLGDILVVASLGGVGFTVSLLMSELAFADERALRVESTLAVLVGSLVSLAVGAAVTAVRSRGYASGRAKS